MRRRTRRSAHRAAFRLGALSLVATSVWLAATAGMVDLAGFSSVVQRFTACDWPLLFASLAGVVVAFAGYVTAYQGITGPGPRRLGTWDRTAIVATGFGGFMLTGGKAVDRIALRGSSSSDRDARIRVMMLHQLEQLPIAVAAFGSSVFLLTTHHGTVPADITLPWVIGTPVGAALALVACRRIGNRFDRAAGWRGWLGNGAAGMRMLGRLLAPGRRGLVPIGGMSLYWLGEVVAVWTAVAAFAHTLSVPTVIVGYATGYAVTRRSAPLGGAGLIDVTLPISIWACGIPLGAAVAGVFCYRVFNFWLALPPALLALPRLRALLGRPDGADRLTAFVLDV